MRATAFESLENGEDGIKVFDKGQVTVREGRIADIGKSRAVEDDMLVVFVGSTTGSTGRVGLGVNFLLKVVKERAVVGSEAAKEDSVRFLAMHQQN